MIINLSYFEDDIKSYLDNSLDKDFILDLTGVVNSSLTQNAYQNIRTKEGVFDIEEKAISNYINFCGKISGLNTEKINIRDIKVSGFPIYWVTDIAVKHYEIHWLSTVFFLDELLKENALQLTVNEIIKIVLPKGGNHSKQLIFDIFVKNGLNPPQLICRGQKTELFYCVRFAKEVILNLIGFFKLKLHLNKYSKRDVRLVGKDIIIVNVYASLWEKEKWESYWADHYNFFSNKADTWVTPFFNRYSGSINYDFSKAPDDFLDAVPSFNKALSIINQSIKAYFKSFLYFRNSNKYIGVEFRKALASTGYFMSHAWYSNFTQKLSYKCLAIYDEEMYYAGRILSHAFQNASNPKINYFGLQHGLFFNPNHTAYTLSDYEITDINKGDGFPLPQKLLVWGDFFKETFLENNSLSESFILSLGSIKHSNAAYEFLPQRIDKDVINVLWCTTLVHFMKSEFSVMRDSFSNLGAKINLVIRKHPYIELPDETLLKLFTDIPMNSLRISKSGNIKEDINKADVVISTSGSTTFLDALLANKISIRVYNYASFPALRTILASSSFFIYNSAEFMNLMYKIANNRLSSNKAEQEDTNYLIYKSRDRWVNFIESTLELDHDKNLHQTLP